jgi:hypothetical protein
MASEQDNQRVLRALRFAQSQISLAISYGEQLETVTINVLNDWLHQFSDIDKLTSNSSSDLSDAADKLDAYLTKEKEAIQKAYALTSMHFDAILVTISAAKKAYEKAE